MTRNKFLLLGVPLLLLLMGCSSEYAGGGSDTEIIGTVTSPNGIPAEMAGARLILVPASYNPSKDFPLQPSQEVIVDGAGRFSLTVSAEGLYNIFGVSADGTTRTFMQSVEVSKSDTVIMVDTLQFATHGTIKVVIPFAYRGKVGHCYIGGTPLYAALDDTITLSFVPAHATLPVYCQLAGMPGALFVDSVALLPGETVVVNQVTRVLFVVDTLGIQNTGGATTVELFNSLGRADLDLTLAQISEVVPATLDLYDVVYLSASVDSLYAIKDALRRTTKPVIVASAELYPQLGMTGNNADSLGSDILSQLLSRRAHPVLESTQSNQSLALFMTPTDIGTVEWGLPDTTSALVVGESSNSPNREFFFYYEWGAMMFGLPAHGYRVGLFGSCDKALNPTGVKIVQNALVWFYQEDQIH